MIQPKQKPIARGVAEALHRELESWEGTPYRPNHQRRGIGADCRSFVLGVLDKLYGIETDLKLLPTDAGLHDPETARSFLHQMARRWSARKVLDGTVEPGDLIISKYPGCGPTHVTIAGPWPWYWHCDMKRGVERIAYDPGRLEFEAIYRLPNKHVWETPQLS